MNETRRKDTATTRIPMHATARVATLMLALAVGLGAARADARQLPEASAPVFRTLGQPRLSLADMPAPKRFVTKHRTTIGGKPISYTAIAGETYITNSYQEPIARFFSFTYLKDGPGDPNRPVLFVFNGGPGAASVWLHMGVIGPRRVVLDREVDPSNTPPFGLRDNPYSPLDVADLVFIDPVGTGFSAAVGHAREEEFYSVDADAEAVSRFIELWLTENGRWNAPKFLMGESYGAARAAVLPRALMGGTFYTGVMRGITVNGVILVGAALNSPQRDASPPAQTGPDPRVGLDLPSQAVVAWYFNKIDRAGRTPEQVYAEAKRFGATQYAEAIFKQNAGALSADEKSALAAKLSSMTGLSAEAWSKADLKIGKGEFLHRILADKGLDAGVYDGRYTMAQAGSGGDPVADDPAMGKYVPGFLAAFNQTLRDDLKVDMKIPYGSIMFDAINAKWDWKRIGAAAGRSYVADLATAMRRNDKLRVMAASGYYDMVSAPASVEDAVKRGGLPLDRVAFRNYESGHMLYLGDTAEAFANDVRAMITARPN